MTPPPGHNSGQASSAPNDAAIPSGYTWADYVAALVEVEGSLTAVAQKLFARGTETDDVNSVERALRRLRSRGQRDGGSWGQRLLRAFGIPMSVEARVRWMGLYHSPFNDLPLPLCLDLLRVWDRPPVSESKARVYIQLGFASTALRSRRFAEARTHFAAARAVLATSHDGVALIEHSLGLAYLESSEAKEEVPALLTEAEKQLASIDIAADERACFEARLADQRAFADNKLRTPDGYRSALARYQALSTEDVHPFASYRREAGLAYGCFVLGDAPNALDHARAAIRHAGDGGFTRLRIMGLLLEARILEGAGTLALERAHSMALRLGDEELLSRVRRARGVSRSHSPPSFLKTSGA